MAETAYIKETPNSRKWDSSSASREYWIIYAADEDDAQSLAESSALIPSALGDLTHRAFSFEEKDSNKNAYKIKVKWSIPGGSKSGTAGIDPAQPAKISFEIAGETRHLYQGINSSPTQVVSTGYDGQVPPPNGTIGATKDHVSGADFQAAVFGYSETHYLESSYLTNSFVSGLYDLAYKVNNAVFRNFPAGSVLFTGVGGQRQGDNPVGLKLNFKVSPNRTNVEVGDMTVPSVNGWQYLDVFYEKTKDSGNTFLYQKPVSVTVQDIFYSGDFSYFPGT